jgi:hypothetical protein
MKRMDSSARPRAIVQRPVRCVRDSEEGRKEPLRDAQDHAQREAVNLKVAERSLEDGDLCEQLAPAGSPQRPPGVPAIEQRLGHEAPRREKDEAHPRLEPLEAPAKRHPEHPGEQRNGEDLEPAASERKGRSGWPQGKGHRHGAEHNAGHHRAEWQQPPAPPGEPRVPHRREHLEREAHDEQPDPSVDLGLPMGVHVLERQTGEASAQAHLPQEPHAPPRAERDHGGDRCEKVRVMQWPWHSGRAHRRPPVAPWRRRGSSQRGRVAAGSPTISASDEARNAASTEAIA